MNAAIGASATKMDSFSQRTLVVTQLPRRPTSRAKWSWSSRKKANCRLSRSATVARQALFPRCPNFSTVSKHSGSSSSQKSDTCLCLQSEGAKLRQYNRSAGYFSRSDCISCWDWSTDLSRTPWQSKNTPILLMFKGLGGVLGLDEERGPAVEENDATTSTDGSGNSGGDLDRPVESADGSPRELEDLIDAISHSSPAALARFSLDRTSQMPCFSSVAYAKRRWSPWKVAVSSGEGFGSCFNRFSASEKGLNSSRRCPLRPCFPPRTLSLMQRRTQREQERPFCGFSSTRP